MRRMILLVLIFLIIALNIPRSLPVDAASKERDTLKQKNIVKPKTIPKQESIIDRAKSDNEFTAIYIPLSKLADQTKKVVREGGHKKPVNSIAFSHDGKTLASGSDDTDVILWDLTSGRRIKTLSGHSNWVRYVAFSPDGRTLASGSRDETIILWDIATGIKLKTLNGHSNDVSSIAFSPDGRTLASGSLDRTVILWDIATGIKLKTLNGHSNDVSSIAFSPDGRTLASGSRDETIILWDIATGIKLKTLSDHSNRDRVGFVAFNPDGKTLASGGWGVVLWDIATGIKIKTLSGHEGYIYSVAFSPDGKTLTSGGLDKTIIIWDLIKILSFSSDFMQFVQTIQGERDEKIKDLFTPKGEFETTKEYEVRIKLAKAEETRIRMEYDVRIIELREKAEMVLKSRLFPYSFMTTLGKYNADKEGFEVDILGEKIFIKVPREKAMEISRHNNNISVKGMLRYFDNEKVELVNAFLLDSVSNERFAFGKYTEAVMTASTQKTPPHLKILSISFSEPSGNGILDAGETGKIKVTVKNNGKGTGFGVSLVFDEAGLAGIRLNQKTYIGTINPNEEKTIDVEISGLEDIKSDDINLKATLLESNGFDSQPVILSFKTKELMPPLLQLVRVDIEDADGKRIITKGKEVNLTLTIQNAGTGMAKSIVVGIESGSGDVKLFGDKKISIGTMSPGESKKAIFSVAVTQRYSGAKTLPISFSVKEERDRFSIKPDIKLALNEEAPDIKVVKVEAKETPIVKIGSVEDINIIPTLSASQKVIGDNDIAVIIGIERYQGIPKSDYSYGDAKLVKAYLTALGFKARNIEFIADEKATQSSIKKTIETWLPNRVKKDSRIFIYYSGHGAPSTRSGEAYIVPFDGDPNYLEDTGYSLKRLYNNLGKLQVAEVTVVLDSCFSGAGGRSVLAKGARPLVMMTDVKVIPSNMAILSATQGTQISTSSTEKGHGVFTYYFLKALKEGKKTIGEIYEYVKPLVEDEAKQLNVQQSPSISPDVNKLKGKFNLRK